MYEELYRLYSFCAKNVRKWYETSNKTGHGINRYKLAINTAS